MHLKFPGLFQVMLLFCLFSNMYFTIIHSYFLFGIRKFFFICFFCGGKYIPSAGVSVTDGGKNIPSARGVGMSCMVFCVFHNILRMNRRSKRILNNLEITNEYRRYFWPR